MQGSGLEGFGLRVRGGDVGLGSGFTSQGLAEGTLQGSKAHDRQATAFELTFLFSRQTMWSLGRQAA